MENELKNIADSLKDKTNLLRALARIRQSNKVFLKNLQRERGKTFASSEEMLAAIQKPLSDQGVFIQMIGSNFNESEYKSFGQRNVKDTKVSCIFSATHLESGESLVYGHSSAGVTDNGVSTADAVEAGKTRCIGSFIRGLILAPKLSMQQLEHAKSTISTQKQISNVNAQIQKRIGG